MHNYAETYGDRLIPYIVEDQARLNYLQTYGGKQGMAQYWFGTVNYDEPVISKQLDFRSSPLGQFMETNYATFQCPDFGPSQMQKVRFGRPASGYAYNGYFLSRSGGLDYLPPTWAAQPSTKQLSVRLADVKQTTQTIAFADSAAVLCEDFACTSSPLQENWILEPPSNDLPTMHFRHNGVANIAYVDGHVESSGTRAFVTPSFGDGAKMDREQLGYLSDRLGNTNFQDEWYDLK
jgi:prepilin-type processing-associated H-X9-DG protein